MAALSFILYRDFLTGSKMLFGSDFIGSGGYVNRKFMADYVAQHGAFAGWLPYIYSGLPTYAAFFGDIFYPPTVLLRLIMPVHVAWTYTFVLHVFLAGLGTYFYLREMKVSPVGAFLMGVAYMFSGSLISVTHEGHDGRLICTALLPFVLLFLERGMNSRKFIYFLLSGAVMGLQLFSGHLQQVYYTLLVVVAYFLFRLIAGYRTEKMPGQSLKLVAYFAIMLIFTGCLVAVQYLPIYGNLGNGVRGASRGWEFATSWAMGPEETFDLITARFSGGLEHYWGRNPFKHHTEYFGILPLMLALFAIVFCWRERLTKFFFGLLVLSLLMAWGGHTPFYYLPYYFFPGVSKFRAPALIFFITTFSLVVLAGFGIRHLLGELREPKKVSRFLIWSVAVAIGLLIISAIGQGAIVSLLSSITHSEASRITANYGDFLTGMLIAAVLVAVNAGLLYAVAQRKLSVLAFAAVAGLILILDTWVVDVNYVKPFPPPAESLAPDEAVRFCQQDTSRFRVFPLYYQDQATGMSKSDNGLLMLYDIQSVGGQHPNPLQNYMDFAGLQKTVMYHMPPNLRYLNFLNLLNVKYVISVPLPEDVSKYPAESQQTIRMLKQYVALPGLSLVHQSQQVAIYRNDSLLPRAFLAQDFEIVSDKNALIARMKQPDFDPRRLVLLSADPGVPHSPGIAGDTARGSAVVQSYGADRIVIEAKLNRPGFLVLSENYHPDWRATDNGTPVRILRAYETLRAVRLGAGSHTVEFRYESKYFRIGSILSLFALLALVGLGAAALVRRKPGPRIPQSVNST
jgi:hypothetical protein